MIKLIQDGKPIAIFLMGPTASGKTKLAIALHQFLPIEIISVDSALIYRGMDIGTAKPNAQELILAPHKLINIRDPAEVYSVADFYLDATNEMKNIIKNGKIPLCVGGSMLYFKILLEGLSPLPQRNYKVRKYIEQKAKIVGWYSLHQKLQKIDPIAASKIHPNDLQRLSRALEVFFISGKTLTELIKTPGNPLKYKIYKFAIIPSDRVQFYQDIKLRFYDMLDAGFEKEVNELFSRKDLHKTMSSIRCVGYRQMWEYLSNKIDYNNMISNGIHSTQQLAKHQLTWLKKISDIYYLDNTQPDIILNKILHIINI